MTVLEDLKAVASGNKFSVLILSFFPYFPHENSCFLKHIPWSGLPFALGGNRMHVYPKEVQLSISLC